MLKTIFVSLVGLTLTIGGLSFNADDILNDTKTAANSANVHQLATALELYYSDHEQYPMALSTGELLVQLEPYLRNKPSEIKGLVYQATENGQNYKLSAPQPIPEVKPQGW